MHSHIDMWLGWIGKHSGNSTLCFKTSHANFLEDIRQVSHKLSLHRQKQPSRLTYHSRGHVQHALALKPLLWVSLK